MEQETGNNKCFVIMPHGKGDEYSGGTHESVFIYNHIIKEAIKSFNSEYQNNLTVDLETEVAEPRSIPDDIMKKLASAKICIADLTGKNPNVFLELGIRFSIRTNNTILMIQEGQKIPFDLNTHWCIKYNTFKVEEAKKQLIGALQSIVNGSDREYKVDSPVFQRLQDMRVSIPSLNVFSYNESKEDSEKDFDHVLKRWQGNITKIRKILKGPVADLHFNPNAVLCISHGRLNGLFTGSLLAHGLFTTTKVLSLWGVRDGREDMFNNEINRQMLQAIKQEAIDGRKNERITLLLIDYKISSGDTASQAIKFVLDELGPNTDIVLCPLFCKSRELIAQAEVILDENNRKTLRDFLPFNYRNKAGRGLDIEEDYFYKIVCVGDGIPENPFYFN